MAGFSSQAGAIVVGTQTAEGTPNTTLATSGIGLRLTSGGLTINRELLVTDPEIGGGRDTSDAYLGAYNVSGEYDAYVRFNMLSFFLYHALGTKATAAVAGDAATVKKHTLTPVDSGTLPMFTVYERISSGLERFLYTDCVVNTLHLESDANGLMTMTVGIIGKNASAGATNVDPTTVMDNTSLVVGTNISMTYGGVTIPGKSFSFDVNNNIEDDDYRMGQFTIGDVTAKSREVTASVRVRHVDASYMKQSTFGTAAATTAGGLTTKSQTVITCASYENVPTSTMNTKYGLVLTIPKALFNPFAFEPSGDDILESDLDMTAVRPSLASPIVTADVTNGLLNANSPI